MLTRRELILKTVLGGGMLGLRSLATGLPISFLLNPRKALATAASEGSTCGASAPQFLILNTSTQGDPLNANVPGMYADPAISHPLDPAMAPTPLTLAGAATTAAAPWASLPQDVLDRTCFFHHGTYTVVHPDEHNVLSLMGETTGDEMLVSMIAQQLSSCLHTVQTQPVSLGAEVVTVAGKPQPLLSPRSLAATLITPTGPLANLQQLRDQDLDALNASARAHGNTAQQAFIDNYALSQRQVREISQNLMSQLNAIPDNSPASQITAAVILIQMNVSPVVTVHIPFGGDNHGDPDLATETAQTVSGVALIAQLMSQLQQLGLQDKVSFASMNVFGRTLKMPLLAGRNHQGNHHCTVMIGAPFKGSVIGGAEPGAGDYQAMSISSTTGAGVPGGAGDIQFGSTLGSVGKTLAAGVGVDSNYLNQNIAMGEIVQPALAS